MPKPRISIRTNIEDGIIIAENLQGELPESADDAAETIANSFISESSRVMQRNGSVVTGQGIRSLQTQQLGMGKYGVFGAGYLEDLDTGTQPHYPDTSNDRFISAARSYGMDRGQLAQVIARKGTRPHPWMADSTRKIRKTAKNRAEIHFQKALQKSLKGV